MLSTNGCVSPLMFLCYIGFLPEATLLASLILCTVCALCYLLQPTVCLRAVWILALSHWREVEEPCKAIMMIFTVSDNEVILASDLGPRTNTQTNTHTLNATKISHKQSSRSPPYFAYVLSVWVKCMQGNQRRTHNLAPRRQTCGPPKRLL